MTDHPASVFKGSSNRLARGVLRCATLADANTGDGVEAVAGLSEVQQMAIAFARGDAQAGEYFGRKLHDITDDNCTIVLVPAPTVGEGPSEPLLRCVRVLADGGRVDASDALVRTTTVPPEASEAGEAAAAHYKTIDIRRPDLVAGRRVLVLDGVTHGPDALRACRDRLLEAGAATVSCVAIVHAAATWRAGESTGASYTAPARGAPSQPTSNAHRPSTQPEPRTFKPGVSPSWGHGSKERKDSNQGPSIRRGSTRRTVVDDNPSSYFDRLRKYGSTGRDE